MVEVSVILPVHNEGINLIKLLPVLKKILESCLDTFEIIVVDAGSQDNGAVIAKNLGAKVLTQKQKGFGCAIKEGISSSRGKYIMTMDADNSHPPEFVHRLVKERNNADLVIGSRFIKDSIFNTNPWRKILSLILNTLFKSLLSLPVNDLSSGFRIYRKEAIKDIHLGSQDFDIQLELLIKVISQGWKVKEIPLTYNKRLYGASKARVIMCGLEFLKTGFKMYRLRNSVISGDYDDRACRSRLVFQKLWHKFKDKSTFTYVDNDKITLDAGCGSGSFIQTFNRVMGLDIDIKKLRYLQLVKNLKKPLVVGNVSQLPFKNGTFEQIVCSEVIEHIPKSDEVFQELYRTLRQKGRLILTTPNYGISLWPLLEWVYRKIMPQSYADKHISHYNPKKLKNMLKKNGFKIIDCKLFLWAISIIYAEK